MKQIQKNIIFALVVVILLLCITWLSSVVYESVVEASLLHQQITFVDDTISGEVLAAAPLM